MGDAGDAALTAALHERAVALGFVKTGVARAEPLGVEAERLSAWLREGRHGSMSWMAETEAVRADPTDARMLEGARSVFVAAAPYARPGDAPRLGLGRVSRYARGRDYHNVLTKRLRKVVRWLESEGHSARLAVDTKPVMERAWAERAGVGFVGKNCCLIVPGLGSYVFLACVVTSAELVPDAPMKQGCGACTRCLDACPTGAFTGPRQLDARRCISYLTIEERGAIPPALERRIGEWLFGCDVCQEVCPYNRTRPEDAAVTEPFAEHPRFAGGSLEELLSMTEAEHAAWAEGSPLRRAGRVALARNAAIVLGNAGDARHLGALERAAREHDAPVVRASAERAIAAIEARARALAARE
ncbi:MAG: tRNA epoxyqueuosine(34) reductase QueG [Myxococcales bacterium]|nr:tRNA epoxyqueuosine(34) reductase QueG [Myxococcales bacterium]